MEIESKETVEQVADKFGKDYYGKDKPSNTYTFHEGFKAGANWHLTTLTTKIENRVKELDCKLFLSKGATASLLKAKIIELKQLLKEGNK